MAKKIFTQQSCYNVAVRALIIIETWDSHTRNADEKWCESVNVITKRWHNYSDLRLTRSRHLNLPSRREHWAIKTRFYPSSATRHHISNDSRSMKWNWNNSNNHGGLPFRVTSTISSSFMFFVPFFTTFSSFVCQK